MARNEEKQLGKLNRLWLQKEREEGHIKDFKEPRPKLAALNSPAALKKWMPSIQREMEYYLQQSQLSHYPERKIAEFRQQIELLETEYKRYLKKLRLLDPSCKHKPWTRRAYNKRRQDSDSSQSIAKRLCVPGCNSQATTEEASSSSINKQDLLKQPTPSASPPSDLLDQDLPLSFDRTRLTIAAGGFWRAPSEHLQDVSTLACVLRGGLPNLHSSKVGGSQESLQPHCSEKPHNKMEHVLGLGCYSSSDEET